jgi:hypothetical protein
MDEPVEPGAERPRRFSKLRMAAWRTETTEHFGGQIGFGPDGLSSPAE